MMNLTQPRRRPAWPLGILATLAAFAGAQLHAEAAFPFDQELLLDTRPLPGSRRVPMLEIAPDGSARIDLWCHSGPGRIEVAGAAATFTLGAMREENCTPDRAQRDTDLAAVLAQVTQWRRDGDVLVLHGAGELRYRLSTH